MTSLAYAASRDGQQAHAPRAVLGLYLAVHFAQLVPFAAELFGTAGMFDASASPFHGHLPNPLFAWPWLATPLVVGATLASLAFMTGWGTRLAAFALWCVWSSLYVRNPLIANPSMPFIGWLLLAHACDATAPRQLPGLRNALFALLAVGYSYSAYTKLTSPSWLDGRALAYVLDNPLARPGALREALLQWPGVLRALSYATLALELLAAPLWLWRCARPALWLTLVLMHLGILVLVDFADLSLGMLVAHAYAFDPAWLARRRQDSALMPGGPARRPNHPRRAEDPHRRADGVARSCRTC